MSNKIESYGPRAPAAGAAADKWWPTLLKGLPKLTALS